MPRRARYSERQILGAAAELVARGGPGAATIGAIGHSLGAPSGSIYHRFPSRNALLGRLWMQKAAQFQDRFVEALEDPNPIAAGLAAALSLPESVRLDPVGARVLLLHRREDFLSADWSGETQAEAARLGAQVSGAMAQITARLFPGAAETSRRVAEFAILDAPMAAVRRHVAAGNSPPHIVDELIRITYAAAVRSARLGIRRTRA